MRRSARRMVVLTLLVMGAAGCATAVRWEKSGASEAERQRDETECVARASRESTVPSAQTVGTTAGTPADPQQTRIRPYDSAVLDECMKARGYTQVRSR
jgi:hypothetical protein